VPFGPATTKPSAYCRQTRELHSRRGTLPGSLNEAIQAAEDSDLLRESLGEHVYESLLATKTIEWDDERRHITDYELKPYLPAVDSLREPRG
jgi:glutamine synthetase